MQPMIFAYFVPKEGSVGTVKTILQGMVANSRTEPGCLAYDFYEVKDMQGKGGAFGLVERYADEAALTAHREQDYYKEYRATIMDYLQAPIDVRILSPIDVQGQGDA